MLSHSNRLSEVEGAGLVPWEGGTRMLLLGFT